MLPPELLQAVVDRRGQIAFVVGAGCSLEDPTGLRPASVYSEAAFEQLKRSGVLEEGDCNAGDLSDVASAVFAKQGRQALLVNALPREKLQHARPNLGHLLVVALIAEGAIACVGTLNFDLALSNAITKLHATDIVTVFAPADLARFGDKAIVYLHGSANEPDAELWVLRREVIEDYWQEGWESVVAQRICTLPHLVFAGLGSKAAALTESLKHVRERVGQHTRTYLVDPAATSEFAGEVTLADPGDHIQLGWVAFMTELAGRLTAELLAELTIACERVRTAHGWVDDHTIVGPVLDALGALNLVDIGLTRGQWLGTGAGEYAPEDANDRSYVPDDTASRDYIADLVLGLGALIESEDCTAVVTEAGTVRLESPSNPAGPLTVHPVTGRGIEPWGVIDRVERACSAAGPRSADVVLCSGLRTKRPESPSAPGDIVGDVPTDDITYAVTSLKIVDVEDLRTDSALRSALAR